MGAYSEKFRIMLKLIPHPDGGEWTGSKMERATDRRVQASYFTSLRDGHIEIPRADKVEAIAHAMRFPPELWFKGLSWWEALYERWEGGGDVAGTLGQREVVNAGRHVSERLNRLLDVAVNEGTGRPLSDEEVANLSGGRLRKEDVSAMREGRLKDPTWAQILALCDVFEVDPAFWSEIETRWRPSAEVLRGIEDQDAYVVFRNSVRLSPSNRSMLRMLSEHLRREERRGGEEG
ncbi:hypothetical protein GBA65_07965 [Rubrobacter marinus]|uniref:Uncharacterized protein n=1 Tax=Rubrobacter marinus TaxID=2653852 RepID=A0A6G8PWA1_9ACTN|nr:hypothetical protein [Rubrobacter marinus]QIN78466.1 hypothetical protein GBA65_07965 [Rubrobacter marinus]